MHIELFVDLRVKWASFNAASTAISNIINSNTVHRIAAQNASLINEFQLPSGLLSVENICDYSELILKYNNVLRWLVLHSGIF